MTKYFSNFSACYIRKTASYYTINYYFITKSIINNWSVNYSVIADIGTMNSNALNRVLS